MTIVWLWTICSSLGLAFSLWNSRDAHRDVRAVEETDGDPELLRTARFFRDSERVRGLQLGTLCAVGIYALAAPFLSAFWTRLIGKAIGWTLLAHVILLMANSAQATGYRLATKEGLSMRKMLVQSALGSAKAIAAGAVAAGVAWAARRGIAIPEWVQILAASAIAGAVVWWTKNRPKAPAEAALDREES